MSFVPRRRERVDVALPVLVYLALGAGCGELEVPSPSLIPRAQLVIPVEGSHLGELVALGDHLYVANSFDALTAVRVTEDGGLVGTLDRPPVTGIPVRCTTLALHEASDTLYCASERGPVFAYDIRDRGAPTLRKPVAGAPDWLHVRDVHVDGDRLMLARFDDGLAFAPIEPDGDLGALVSTEVAGNIRHVAADGERALALSQDRGLLSLRWDGVTYVERAALVLDGPPIDLSLRGERAAVALGSAGAALVSLADPDAPTLVHRVTPPAVVTSADVEGDAFVALGLAGPFLYDLRPQEPVLVGFARGGGWAGDSPGTALSARFVAGGLLVSDWNYVTRYAIDLDGVPLDIDHPRGAYVGPDDAVAFGLRNPGPLAFEVLARSIEDDELARVSLAPQGEATLEIASSAIGVGRTELFIETYLVEGDARSRLVSSRLVVAVRGAASDPRPPAGARFPEVLLAEGDQALVSLPLAEQRFRAVFLTMDCAAMWPELDDAVWLSARAALDGGARPVIITPEDLTIGGHLDRWALGDVVHGHYMDVDTPPEVAAFNAPYEEIYAERFLVEDLPSGAAHPTDYLVDARGDVLAVEREYRGAYPLHSGR